MGLLNWLILWAGIVVAFPALGWIIDEYMHLRKSEPCWDVQWHERIMDET